MQTAMHIKAKVLPGNRIEIKAPELREGGPVDVFLVLPEAAPKPRQSIIEFLDSLPAGPRTCKTWEETERFLREERKSWER